MGSEGSRQTEGPAASRQLLGRGSIYTLATAAPMLAALIITPALTRALTQAEYGLVSVGLTVMQFTINLLALGLPTAITRHAIVGDSGPQGARTIAARGALLALAISIAASLVGLLTTAAGLGIPTVVLLGILTGGAGAGVAMAQAVSLAEDKPGRYVWLAFGLSLVAPAAGLAVVLTLRPESNAYYATLLLVYLVVDLLAFEQLRRHGFGPRRPAEFKDALAIALPMVPHQLAVGAATAAAVWIASIRLGIVAAAEAQPALQLATMALVVTSALSYAWTPIVLRAKPAQQGPLLTETAAVVSQLAALGGGVTALLAPWVLRFLTPYDLAGMVPLAAITAFTATLAAGYLAHLQLVVAAGATRPLAALSPAALLAGAVASWLLIGGFGLPALGLGYLTTYAFLFVFTRGLARRATPVRWNDRGLGLAWLLGAGLCASGALLGWNSGADIAIRLLLAAGAAAVAVALFGRRLRNRPTNATGT